MIIVDVPAQWDVARRVAGLACGKESAVYKSDQTGASKQESGTSFFKYTARRKLSGTDNISNYSRKGKCSQKTCNALRF
jgi:hypothetical protein